LDRGRVAALDIRELFGAFGRQASRNKPAVVSEQRRIGYRCCVSTDGKVRRRHRTMEIRITLGR
jgi:hypothetical protein